MKKIFCSPLGQLHLPEFMSWGETKFCYKHKQPIFCDVSTYQLVGARRFLTGSPIMLQQETGFITRIFILCKYLNAKQKNIYV